MNKKIIVVVFICLILSVDGISIFYLENPQSILKPSNKNNTFQVDETNLSIDEQNDSTIITDTPSLDDLNQINHHDNADFSEIKPQVDTSNMSKTVDYNTSEFEDTALKLADKEYTINDVLEEVEGKRIEYIETYKNETHTIINKSITILNIPPLNLEDAIDKGLPKNLINSFQIIKKQQVTDYNKHLISIEFVNNSIFIRTTTL